MMLKRQDLKAIPLFQGSDLDILYGILKNSPIHRISPKKIFIKQGEESQSMYLVLKGELSVHVEKLEDDAIMILRKGDSVGELAILDEKPRSAFVVAKKESCLLEVKKDTFWSLINSSHEIALNLLLILSARLRGNNETITESIELQKKYKTISIVDNLTNLYNRKWLNETLPKLIKRVNKGEGSVSLAMIDIDKFKQFNDTYGHQTGDFVLSSLAKAYKDNIRPTDFAARYGGEEFTLIFPNRTIKQAKTAAERVRKSVMTLKLVTPKGIQLPQVTISIGLAEFDGKESMEDLIARADKALYQAKENGRNQLVM